MRKPYKLMVCEIYLTLLLTNHVIGYLPISHENSTWNINESQEIDFLEESIYK